MSESKRPGESLQRSTEQVAYEWGSDWAEWARNVERLAGTLCEAVEELQGTPIDYSIGIRLATARLALRAVLPKEAK